jgi:hypothetical protein
MYVTYHVTYVRSIPLSINRVQIFLDICVCIFIEIYMTFEEDDEEEEEEVIHGVLRKHYYHHRHRYIPLSSNSVQIFLHIHIYIYVYKYVYLYILIYKHIYMYIYKYIKTYIYTYLSQSIGCRYFWNFQMQLYIALCYTRNESAYLC